MKTKILQIIDGLNIGGAEILLVDLVTGIQQAGLDVLVGYSTPGVLKDRLEEAGVPCIRLPRYGRVDPFLFLNMCRLILLEKPDVVHTHLFKSDLHGRLAAAVCRVPVIVSTLHNTDVWAKKPLLGRIYGATAAFANQLIAVTEEVRNYQIEHTGISPRKIVVIKNGIRVEKFQPNPNRKQALRDELRISTGIPLVGIIGRLQPQKDHGCFLRSAALIWQAMPQARFVVIGEGPLREDLQAQAAQLGLEDAVVFCGLRQDIPEVLASLNILVISSLWEGLPVTLLEAMAAGIPVVATQVGGIPEVVQSETSALLVPPGSPEALAEACLRILRDRKFAARLAQNALDVVRSQYSVDAMIAKTLMLYKEFLEAHAGHQGA